MAEQSIVDRVEALLLLAVDAGASEHEARTAALQAARLIAKHGLRVSDGVRWPAPNLGEHERSQHDSEVRTRSAVKGWHERERMQRVAQAAPNLDKHANKWRAFALWCLARGETALPCSPATLVKFLWHEHDRGQSCGSLDSAVSAIRHHHLTAGVAEDLLPTNAIEVKQLCELFAAGRRRPKRKVATA